ncbi:MAG TPA: S24 family peptidase [Candidatus Saccharimonadales bacterium]|nr:S24 family peptidase [Candidatus Saccharimonadales bacterium]
MDEANTPDGVSIHTGFPNPAADSSLHGLDLHKLLVQHSASTYLFRVRGNEWEDAGVFDGDIAIVDRALDPRRSDVVLWWDSDRGEFAVTTYKGMPPNASCWGVVTASIHEFRKINTAPGKPASGKGPRG